MFFVKLNVNYTEYSALSVSVLSSPSILFIVMVELVRIQYAKLPHRSNLNYPLKQQQVKTASNNLQKTAEQASLRYYEISLFELAFTQKPKKKCLTIYIIHTHARIFKKKKKKNVGVENTEGKGIYRSAFTNSMSI